MSADGPVQYREISHQQIQTELEDTGKTKKYLFYSIYLSNAKLPSDPQHGTNGCGKPNAVAQHHREWQWIPGCSPQPCKPHTESQGGKPPPPTGQWGQGSESSPYQVVHNMSLPMKNKYFISSQINSIFFTYRLWYWPHRKMAIAFIVGKSNAADKLTWHVISFIHSVHIYFSVQAGIYFTSL